jgi:hypothetical protein
MAKTFKFKSTSSADLTQRKVILLSGIRIPASAVRASCVSQFLTCGKRNCRCHRGAKHGPFNYLIQCMGAGNVRKFLLKTPTQRNEARASIAAYVAFQEQLEELSQINTELLRREELKSDLSS